MKQTPPPCLPQRVRASLGQATKRVVALAGLLLSVALPAAGAAAGAELGKFWLDEGVVVFTDAVAFEQKVSGTDQVWTAVLLATEPIDRQELEGKLAEGSASPVPARLEQLIVYFDSEGAPQYLYFNVQGTSNNAPPIGVTGTAKTTAGRVVGAASMASVRESRAGNYRFDVRFDVELVSGN